MSAIPQMRTFVDMIGMSALGQKQTVRSAVGMSDKGHKRTMAPRHACDHCNLCNGATPPLPPDTMLANRFEPARTLHVLRPVNVARYFGRPQARPRPSGFRLTQSLPRPASFNPSSRYGNFPCCKMHML